MGDTTQGGREGGLCRGRAPHPASPLTRLKWVQLTHVRCLLSVPAICLMFYIPFPFNPQSHPEGRSCDDYPFDKVKVEAQSDTKATPTRLQGAGSSGGSPVRDLRAPPLLLEPLPLSGAPCALVSAGAPGTCGEG